MVGECRQVAGGFWAFVPAPLPPELHFDSDLILALSGADTALGEVAGLALGGAIPRMHMLLRTFAQREAVLSSRIEGTQTQLDELLLAEVRGRARQEHGDLREVQNYLRAINLGIELLTTMPIATRLILRLHEALMEGVRGGDKTPGEFRRIQNFIGRPEDTAATARYVPPPPEELNRLLANWERFANDRGKLPDLIQCAVLHEQFEAIHPFQDGNGRIGRLLITLFLIARGRLAQPLLPLSAFIERHRRDYYDTLQGVRTDGDWNGWIRYFLAGVTHTARQTTRQARALDALRRGYREALRGDHRARELIDELFVNPFITVAKAADRLKVSKPTSQRTIDILQKSGILGETTGRPWGRIYVARAILDAIESPPDDV
ncbi:MAG TPA: Fic family protein [Tepidisphaeraceae bacterium]|nr:Fic family protein [Tepidisphaeraceae bacterium]